MGVGLSSDRSERTLKEKVLASEVFLRAGFKVKLVFGVVFLEEVLDDGAGLPESDSGVGVFDDGDTGCGRV